MSVDLLLAVLSLGTIAVILVFAFLSRRRTDLLFNDEDHPNATLAKDPSDSR